MATVLPPVPDGEDVVMAIVDPAVAPAVQSTPPEFTPPLIQVVQTGGSSNRVDGRPLIDVACFGADYPAAKAMARECEQLILAASGTRVTGVPGYPDGVFVDRAVTDVLPREVNYEDPGKRRRTARYRLIMRRQ